VALLLNPLAAGWLRGAGRWRCRWAGRAYLAHSGLALHPLRLSIGQSNGRHSVVVFPANVHLQCKIQKPGNREGLQSSKEMRLVGRKPGRRAWSTGVLHNELPASEPTTAA
jgi:hypothetical protein